MNDLNKFLKLLGLDPDPDRSILKNGITNNGNCFFHALEYALGNCTLDEQSHPLLNQDRHTAVSLLRKIYESEYGRVFDSNQAFESKDRELDELSEKVEFLEKFDKVTGQNYEYSTEEVIQITAYLKEKILFIFDVEPIPPENTQYGFTLIEPIGVEFKKENIVILIRTGQNHYDTLRYPLDIPVAFVERLSRFRHDPNSPHIMMFELVKVKPGNVHKLLNETMDANEIAARELQDIFDEANRDPSQEYRNRIFAEQLQRKLNKKNRDESKSRKLQRPRNQSNKRLTQRKVQKVNLPRTRKVKTRTLSINRKPNDRPNDRPTRRDKNQQFPPPRK